MISNIRMVPSNEPGPATIINVFESIVEAVTIKFK